MEGFLKTLHRNSRSQQVVGHRGSGVQEREKKSVRSARVTGLLALTSALRWLCWGLLGCTLFRCWLVVVFLVEKMKC